VALCVCSVIFSCILFRRSFSSLLSLGPKRPPVAIYGKFSRGEMKGNPFCRLQYPRCAASAGSLSFFVTTGLDPMVNDDVQHVGLSVAAGPHGLAGQAGQ
jgi:hypothetical protein